MPIRSQLQARYELAHPEKFSKEKVIKQLRRQGGLHRLPFRKSGSMRNNKRISTMSRKHIRRELLKRRGKNT